MIKCSVNALLCNANGETTRTDIGLTFQALPNKEDQLILKFTDHEEPYFNGTFRGEINSIVHSFYMLAGANNDDEDHYVRINATLHQVTNAD